MALVDRWDEESQAKGENIEMGVVTDAPKKKGNVIFTVLALVFFFWVILWTVMWPKLQNYGTLYIDNPTENEISVQIWELEKMTIPANSSKEIDLKPGTYALSVNDESVWEFKKWMADWKSFLNPTKSTYVLEEAIYTVDENTEVPDNNTTITIWDEEFYWPFKVYNEYYISWDWGYWLDEETPTSVMTQSKNYTTVKKIYRLDDFEDMYNDYYLPYYEE